MSDLFPREDTCLEGNHYNGEHLIARITAVPVVFALSALGSFFPLVALYSSKFRLPNWLFFITKNFGSGVIVATGFIHLLAEASVALTNPCLGGVFAQYPFAEGIALMAVFVFFFFDMLANKTIHEKAKCQNECCEITASQEQPESTESSTKDLESCNSSLNKEMSTSNQNTTTRTDTESEQSAHGYEKLYQQILNCVVLECGIVLHSVFVGLSLAIAGNEFISLYIAICFHQFFEGLGLGTRFATTPWPKGKKYVPWLMAFIYSLTTPAAVAIGVGVRKTYPVGSRTALITTGTFDATCAGVLIYNSIADLMAYDFIYSDEFKEKSTRTYLAAYFWLAFGAFAMALIGKWA
ncbi:Zinc-regulated transporter 1 [Spathaspora sp. JA1]|nr:Zinc-regulated transporter 1 [Spathaspora sp. JA1]